MRNQLNAAQAQIAYCKLLKLIQDTSQNVAEFPGADWEPVLDKLNDALLKAKEVLAAHGIDSKYIKCE